MIWIFRMWLTAKLLGLLVWLSRSPERELFTMTLMAFAETNADRLRNQPKPQQYWIRGSGFAVLYNPHYDGREFIQELARDGK